MPKIGANVVNITKDNVDKNTDNDNKCAHFAIFKLIFSYFFEYSFSVDKKLEKC